MRLLVTGGAGFIGSHFVRTALTEGYPGLDGVRITVLDKLTYAGNPANLAPVEADPRYAFAKGDIVSAADLDAVVPGHDAIVNFAAESHVDRSITGASEFVLTNVLGAQQVFEAALRHRIPRVVHVSTDEVYGSIPIGEWTEEHVLEPNSPYSAAKAGADLIARSYVVTYGLNLSVTRCSNNYGPYQYPEKVIPLFVTNLIDGLNVPLYGDGLNVRDWLHVDDHCRGIALVLTAGGAGEIYNIAGGRELANKELTALLLEACDADWDRVDYVEDRLGHDRRYALDHSKLGALGYSPRVRFEDGLAQTVQWYRDNRAWWEPLKGSG